MTGSLLGVASTNFAYFYWYSVVRSLYLSRQKIPGTAPSTAIELSLGAVAGALAQLFTIPIAVVTTRQQTQPKHDRRVLYATAKEVIDGEDGWTGLWRGLKASLVLVVNPAITYGAYQRLKDGMFPGKKLLTPGEAFRKLQPQNAASTCIAVTNSRVSSRCSLKIDGNACNTAAHCCQGWSPVKATTSAEWQTVQELHRSHGVYHRA